MKTKLTYILLMTVLFAGVVIAETVYVRGFMVRAINQQAVIEWTSTSEAGVTEYRILRSFDGFRFHQIATVKPVGDQQNYRYTDEDLFKDKVNTYYYRVQVSLSTGRTELSETADVSFGSNNVRRTWGSIKALFR